MAAAIVLAALFVVGSAIVLDAILPFPASAAARRTMGMVTALALLALGAVGAFVALRSALSKHRRRFAPVWIDDVTGDGLVLAVRDRALARDIARASGIAPAGYREDARPAAPYRPRRRWELEWLLFGVLGIGSFVVAFERWGEVGRAEAQGRTFSVKWIEWIAYSIGGRVGLVALWVSIGALLLSLAILAFLPRRQGRATSRIASLGASS